MDIPEDALSVILYLMNRSYDITAMRKDQSKHYHYQSLHKQAVNKRHANEKEHMVTLRDSGCATAEYVGLSGTAEATSSTVTEQRDMIGEEEDQPSEDEGKFEEVSVDVSLPSSDALPLLFFFDCESTGGSMYNDHIIEVGAKVVAVPGSVSINKHQYGSLIHASQNSAQDKCGITMQVPVAEPRFKHVLEELLAWICLTVQEVCRAVISTAILPCTCCT